MSIDNAPPRISAATLVITGEYDLSTPPERGQAIEAQIPSAQLTTLPCAHIPMTELPCLWSDTVLGFLDAVPAYDEAQRYTVGLARRKQVLGVEYVERRMEAITPFNQRFQALITQLAWGQVWTSSRFDDLTRRVAVLSMTTALGRWEEFELHVAAALRAGVEPEVIEETLVQASIYCGVPAANTGFSLAGTIIAASKRPPA